MKQISNEYADALGNLYHYTPKAVLAAILVSKLSCGGEHINEISPAILDEWKALYENGIVPQKPPEEAKP